MTILQIDHAFKIINPIIFKILEIELAVLPLWHGYWNRCKGCGGWWGKSILDQDVLTRKDEKTVEKLFHVACLHCEYELVKIRDIREKARAVPVLEL